MGRDPWICKFNKYHVLLKISAPPQNIQFCFGKKNYGFGADLKKVFIIIARWGPWPQILQSLSPTNPFTAEAGLQMLFGTWLMKSTLVNVITISRDPALSWQYHLLFLLYASLDRLQTRLAELITWRQALFMGVGAGGGSKLSYLCFSVWRRIDLFSLISELGLENYPLIHPCWWYHDTKISTFPTYTYYTIKNF